MDNAQQENSLLTFLVGPIGFCVEAVDVDTIVTPPTITHLPKSPFYIPGVFPHRGDISVIIDLRRKFGLLQDADPESGQLILSHLVSGLKAFWVDEVVETTLVSHFSWEDVDSLVDNNIFDKFALHDDKITLHTTFELLYKAPASEMIEMMQRLAQEHGLALPESDVKSGDTGENHISKPTSESTGEEDLPVTEDNQVNDSQANKESGSSGSVSDSLSNQSIKEQNQTLEPEKLVANSDLSSGAKQPGKPGSNNRVQAFQAHRGANLTGATNKPANTLNSGMSSGFKANSPGIGRQIRSTSAGPGSANRTHGGMQTPTSRLGNHAPQGKDAGARSWQNQPERRSPRRGALPRQHAALNSARHERHEKYEGHADSSSLHQQQGRSTNTNQDNNQGLPLGWISALLLLLLLLGLLWWWSTGDQSTDTYTGINSATETSSHEQTERLIETQPVESLPVESLPVESLPVESLPVESLPVNSQPVEIFRYEDEDISITVERPSTQEQVVIVEPSDTETQIAIDDTALDQHTVPLSGTEIRHVVVKGDTLWYIARKYLGNPFRYPELANNSQIRNPDLIYPGDIVRIVIKTKTNP